MNGNDHKVMQEMIETAVARAVPLAVSVSVAAAVREAVNGKIDGLRNLVITHNNQHEGDMRAIRKFMAGVSALKMIGDFLKWAGSLAIAWLGIRALIAGTEVPKI